MRAPRAAGLEAGEGDVVAQLRRQGLDVVQHRPPVAVPLAEMTTAGSREAPARLAASFTLCACPVT